MRVIIFHQHDPTVSHVGGIGTFINTFVKYAPAALEVSLVGVTSDPAARPVGRWQQLNLGGRSCEFLPIVAARPSLRDRIPLSLRFTQALRRFRDQIDFQDAILEFHRIEPSLALQNVGNPKVLFLHGHATDLHNPKTEVTWRRFPWLYFQLERRLISAMQHTYIVREDAVAFYQGRYPVLADRFSFLPTWVDQRVFWSMAEGERRRVRQYLMREQGLDPRNRLVLFVGRFEGQKDPLLLLEVFRRLNGKTGKIMLILIGAGTLEASMNAFVRDRGLTDCVRILGPKPQREIARWMNIADCLCLSSAFEGMPRVVAEALSCGLPVVSTDAGEARRLLHDFTAGRLVQERTPEALGAAITAVLSQPRSHEACQRQVASYTAGKVLDPVYRYYQTLGNGTV